MKQKARTHAWRIAAIASALLTLCVGWVVFDHLFTPRASKGQSVEIPRFEGFPYEGLQIPDWMTVETEYRYDADALAGTVLSQTPAAGNRRKLTKESPMVRVVLTVSMGRETVCVPDLVGRDAREAEAELRARGFAVKLRQIQSAYPIGRVLEMKPIADTHLPVGSEILLTVSAGTQNDVTEVPELYGLSRADALIALWLAGLTVGEVIEEPSAQPGGTVIRQSHRAGTIVRTATKITVYVSRE